ncbi:alpha-amylase [Granulicella sp. 5B5]|uniref:alpha-amylase family glycosyl hydrolase n=1 Tax=Granulicella sp. 5B5 TaxID=1617967 RepID=UPI0015F718C6|nr:alpha-amylase family glycosyl hydrolase [Granulicella sp. 5B5]QMV17726.1 alpha-amylase [Granulicella sp. 5B5]
MEFHISQSIRERLDLDDLLFSFTGNVVFANVAASRKLAQKLNTMLDAEANPEKTVNAGALFAMGLIDELSHALVAKYRRERDPAVMAEGLRWLQQSAPKGEAEKLLLRFTQEFPTVAVYRGELSAEKWLQGSTEGRSNREIAFEEMLLLWLANSNPAFAPFKVLFEDDSLKKQTVYKGVTTELPQFFATRPPMDSKIGTLLDALIAPMKAAPDSLTAQLDFIGEHWAPYLGDELKRVLLAIDVLREEELAVWMRFHPAGPDRHRHGAPGFGGEGFVGDEFVGFESEWITGADGVRRRRYAHDYQAPLNEYEAFSADQAWMPTAVLIAKSTYVWLEQLSKKYLRHIHRLDQIPDEELQILADRGITGLWLIGLWERSRASKTIKRLRGNRDAVASAYSLKDYLIAEDLGGEQAYEDLRWRASRVGLRLASDMVPNHMGLDSDWVIEHPDWFLWRHDSPYPAYSFEGPDLSTDSRVEIKIEDHYYDQTDAAVVYRLRHYRDGQTRFVYHGNDGTMFAWNDTAQLDYSKAEVREHVMQVILNVARRFPIIRFDAAMVLAKRHVQRLWFPLPGAGGSIPSRAEYAISDEQFNELMPHEFWREVVDRVAVEVPGTLLLAEAFWLLESYFVRTLGMHRVYNSAFMNMLRDEENAKYRSYLKKTVEFDPEILKRYVNFMSNPDERTAIDQFGSGDKYFGTSVLLATLPGLPMFGHGQIEGYTERYGMDFKVARLDEHPNNDLIGRHNYLIAPLLKNRKLWAESENFLLYDFWTGYGHVDENVFAYSNMYEGQRGVILYNNRYESTHGTIRTSVGYLEKHTGNFRQKDLGDGLRLPGEPWMVMAYRDTVQGLEFLRRASDLREHGLTVELRGYQHMVLVEWRALQPTEAYPWDRLCDALNGSGVYSVDDALTELRLQPLVEALHAVINEANIQSFVKAALAKAASAPAVEAKSAEVVKASAVEADAVVDDVVKVTPAPVLEPGLVAFVESVRGFRETAMRLARPEVLEDGSSVWAMECSTGAKGESCAAMAAAALQLPELVMKFPEALQSAARAMLPCQGMHGHAAQMWAPVLAWIAVRALPSPAAALAVYDELRLRHALAEVFSAVGETGEQVWREAAQVRVLLLMSTYKSCSEAVASSAFWSDGDVRWLTGVQETGEVETVDLDTVVKVERFEREKLEAFVCWLKLPALLAASESCSAQASERTKAANEVTAIAANVTYAAKVAKYEVRRFLEQMALGARSPKRNVVEEDDAASVVADEPV